MARGWESKSVEEQVEQQSQEREAGESARNGQRAAEQAERVRQRMGLELQRERILDERTSNPIRRRALEAALADIESKLAAL
jgi:hypothetical protein